MTRSSMRAPICFKGGKSGAVLQRCACVLSAPQSDKLMQKLRRVIWSSARIGQDRIDDDDDKEERCYGEVIGRILECRLMTKTIGPTETVCGNPDKINCHDRIDVMLRNNSFEPMLPMCGIDDA